MPANRPSASAMRRSGRDADGGGAHPVDDDARRSATGTAREVLDRADQSLQADRVGCPDRPAARPRTPRAVEGRRRCDAARGCRRTAPRRPRSQKPQSTTTNLRQPAGHRSRTCATDGAPAARSSGRRAGMPVSTRRPGITSGREARQGRRGRARPGRPPGTRPPSRAPRRAARATAPPTSRRCRSRRAGWARARRARRRG